jgi:dTDP-4-dehydrorhamnose 3,5-epimerase
MLEVRGLGLDGVAEIVPAKLRDDRGFLSETYNAARLAEAGIHLTFVQDNHSHSTARGVLRGLHYQAPPFAQDKLVRVAHGVIFDVAVDIRRGSPTFGKWVGTLVTADRWNQVLVPKGFAHGFVTLEPETDVLYKLTAPFEASHDRAIRFDDPDIGIGWPIPVQEMQISDKDRAAPRLREIETGFVYP